jgi:hypothetical protein
MTSHHWCYYQHTDTITDLGSCQSHVGGQFAPMETPRQLQGTVALWHVTSQLGIITRIGFPIEWKWDDVRQNWARQQRELNDEPWHFGWADKCVWAYGKHESNWPLQHSKCSEHITASELMLKWFIKVKHVCELCITLRFHIFTSGSMFSGHWMWRALLSPGMWLNLPHCAVLYLRKEKESNL